MHSGGRPVTSFGACILGVEGTRLTPGERALFGRVAPFGFILFARNIDTASQVRALCADLRAVCGHDAPITVDQEGGRVQRLNPPAWRDWPPPLAHVQRAGERAAEAMYLRYRIIASELRDLGIDSNCAPLVDVATLQTHPFLTNRCYGTDAAEVGRIGRAVAEGLLDGGVLPVVKHMPGHGRAVTDSHHDLPVVDAPADTLDAVDFAPFRALADLPMGMTAHVVYSARDPRPATLSPVVMRAIRDEIGFDGLIMTDDISMGALAGTLSENAVAARGAGCDVVLHCNGIAGQAQLVAEAAGTLEAEGHERALRAMAARRDPDDVDIPALAARLDSIVNGQRDG